MHHIMHLTLHKPQHICDRLHRLSEKLHDVAHVVCNVQHMRCKCLRIVCRVFYSRMNLLLLTLRIKCRCRRNRGKVRYIQQAFYQHVQFHVLHIFHTLLRRQDIRQYIFASCQFCFVLLILQLPFYLILNCLNIYLLFLRTISTEHFACNATA